MRKTSLEPSNPHFISRSSMKWHRLRLIGILIAIQVFFVYFFGQTNSIVSYVNPKYDGMHRQRPSASYFSGLPAALARVVPKDVEEMTRLFQEQERQSTDPRRVFFAHVGKSGGESVRSTLRLNCQFLGNRNRKRACWTQLYHAFYGKNVTQPGEPLLSQLTKGFLHYLDLKPEGENLRATHFLFCVRHPVHRLESWFRYVAPVNCAHVKEKAVAASCRVATEIKRDPTSFQAKFFACFPTIHTIPQTLQQYRSRDDSLYTNSTALACAEMLVNTLQGKTGSHMAGHMIANLQYYHHFTLGNSPVAPWGRRTMDNRGNGDARGAKVLVVRTPHLWEDMKKADETLGGAGYFSQAGLRISHQSEHFDDMAVLDHTQTLPICCALGDEMAIYKELIERSINLDEVQKQSTLKEALTICRVQSWEELIHMCGLTNNSSSLLHRPPFVAY